MEIHWLKDMMNQLVDCKIDKMMLEVTRMKEMARMTEMAPLENHMTEMAPLENHMTEMAPLENHKLTAVGPGYTRAVVQLTHKTVVNQSYMMTELGCSLELERTHMRVRALLICRI